MKKIFTLLMLISLSVFAGTPTIDGTFDGVGVWGTAVATSDLTTGWAGANSKSLYVTYDATYVYFGAEVTASDWQAWAFIVNNVSGGAASDSWSRQVFYDQGNKPDFDFRGHFGGYCEFHSWNGSSWTNLGSQGATEFAESIAGSNQDGFVEVRVPLTLFGSNLLGDIQFYITGDNNDHGSFDAIPNDDNSAGWNPPTSTSNMTQYATSVPLPVELVSFIASVSDKAVNLNWKTATELNNSGFAIERSADSKVWSNIGFVAGAGNSSSYKEYTFNDNTFTAGKNYYRLKQIDNDGSFKYSEAVEVLAGMPNGFMLEQNYPNPFNPSTSIKFAYSENTAASLKLYDVLGNEIAELFNGTAEAGKTYELKFNAGNLSSGIYYYKLEGTGRSEIKKMILVK